MKYTVGFEIEGVFNWEGEDDIGGYGFEDSTEVSSHWKAGYDSSINHGNYDFPEARCIEFVSEVLNNNPKSSSYWKKGLKEFQNLFGGDELNECCGFNTSCGAHIHFRETTGNKLHRRVCHQFEEMLYARFRKGIARLVKSEILPKRIANQILKAYYRGYANKGGDTLRLMADYDTAEWRSFNLTGIETWEQFHALYELAMECVEYFLKLQGKKVTITIR